MLHANATLPEANAANAGKDIGPVLPLWTRRTAFKSQHFNERECFSKHRCACFSSLVGSGRVALERILALGVAAFDQEQQDGRLSTPQRLCCPSNRSPPLTRQMGLRSAVSVGLTADWLTGQGVK